MDGDIFQQLTFDRVGAYTGGEPLPFTLVEARGLRFRGFPRGLDVPAALGSKEALELIKAGGDDRFKGYAENLEKLRRRIADLEEKTWAADLYVEPVPGLYRTVRSSLQKLKENLLGLGFPKDRALAGNLERLSDTLKTLETIAVKELEGKKLTATEYSLIENIGSALAVPRYGFAHHRDAADPFMMEIDDKMPVIADVFTNLDAREALEEGVGMPMILYLRVHIEGTPTVCVGAVYSYYEFRHPMKDRLTDEAWRSPTGSSTWDRWCNSHFLFEFLDPRPTSSL